MKNYRIIAISDSHNQYKTLTIPECDILINCGDMTSMGYEHEIRDFFKWFKKQPAKHHVSIMGNHESMYEKNLPLSKTWVFEEFPEVHLLADSEVIIDDIKIYGTPWQPEFYNWAFNLPRGHPLRNKWRLIPDDTNILVIHGPPMNILDYAPVCGNVGCFDLAQRIKEVKPDLHFFGHIHYSFGEKHIDGTSFYNVSVCTEMYVPSKHSTAAGGPGEARRR